MQSLVQLQHGLLWFGDGGVCAKYQGRNGEQQDRSAHFPNSSHVTKFFM